jgi:hypothetical protein
VNGGERDIMGGMTGKGVASVHAGDGRGKDLGVPSGGDLGAKDIPVAGEVVRDRLWGVGGGSPLGIQLVGKSEIGLV